MRPNQGVLSPGANVEVTILLVDKDQQLLLQNYDKLGFSQEAFDAATKDKFLVQSAGLLKEYEHLSSTSIESLSKRDSEQLTSFWNKVAKSSDTANKKLLVRHIVMDDGETAAANTPSSSTAAAVIAAAAASKSTVAAAGLADESDYSDMTPEKLIAEVKSLRKKYDDLVMFSVNLTAERDILNNSLEQTQREMLNLEREKKSAMKMKQPKTVKSEGFGYVFTFLLAILMYSIGKYNGTTTTLDGTTSAEDGEL